MVTVMNSPVIDVQDVCFAYKNDDNVLENINLQIEVGDFVAMIGPNGGGKTTLLKLLLGLYPPRTGTIRIFQRPPHEVTHRIGYVPQQTDINLRFPISALDVVRMGCLRPGVKWARLKHSERHHAMTALEQLGMADMANRRIGNLSGGQRQRIFIARALMAQPDILFLDEPTSGIDAQGQTELYCLLEQLNAHITIVMVSHDILAVSTHVKSVACVNKDLHYHNQSELTHEMMEAMYHHMPGEACPVELIAHGVPHRVLKPHKN